ncbi:SOH1 family protein [Cryptosporidium ryanae]|uniref:SOH1 family protein n=1 Tax=Cryptosporidium ryanae TaxID=515981 RepID=UPI003519EE4D|nr:SOH1 family protein [Cryptosporidium ryanae]
MLTESKSQYKIEDDNKNLRFMFELEFVQCLSNPDYLQWLSKEGYFEDKSFIRYLKYLLYWSEFPYNKYISYPYCIRMLRLLQDEDFRKSLEKEEVIQVIRHQQTLQWIYADLKKEDINFNDIIL